MPAKRSVRILRTVVLDLLLAGLILVVFALFHHVLPRDAGYQGETLPTLTPTQPAAVPSASPSAQPQSTRLIAWRRASALNSPAYSRQNTGSQSGR